jgi:hypothetical protein
VPHFSLSFARVFSFLNPKAREKTFKKKKKKDDDDDDDAFYDFDDDRDDDRGNDERRPDRSRGGCASRKQLVLRGSFG